MTELAKACRMIAALQPHEKGSDDLLNAARRLAAATANLLKASQPENLEVINHIVIITLNMLLLVIRIGRSYYKQL